MWGASRINFCSYLQLSITGCGHNSSPETLKLATGGFPWLGTPNLHDSEYRIMSSESQRADRVCDIPISVGVSRQ